MAKGRKPPSRREPTIALINVVFLMLVFFMVAGTIAPPMSQDVTLIQSAELQGRAPPDALVIHADGQLEFRGAPVATASAYVLSLAEDQRNTIRIVPDRDLPAHMLVALSTELRQAGTQHVLLITQRGLQ